MAESFTTRYGESTDAWGFNKVNFVCYILTDGGDKIRDGSMLESELLRAAVAEFSRYPDTSDMTAAHIGSELAFWCKVVRGEASCVPRSLP
jgi:hypothetical protein